jgi:prepilin-type N-terminal cleavage/methylation domain-containing protein
MIRETHISGHRRSERGFSLLELVVVLTITALLTALLFPGMRAARDSAQRLICASNLRQLGMATITYSMNQRGEQLPGSQVAQSGRRLDQMALSWHGDADAEIIANRGRFILGRPEFDGLGLLVRDSYCDSPKCLYCPSHTGRHNYEENATLLQGPMFLPSELKRTIFANYQYVGDDGNSETLNTLDPDDILITDGFRTKADFNHRIGMNQIMGDLSIQWWQDEQNRFFLGLPDSPIDSVEEHGLIFNSIWGLVDEDYRINDETNEN